MKIINIVVGQDSYKVHKHAVSISEKRNCGDYTFEDKCVSVSDYYEHDIFQVEEEVTKIRNGKDNEVSDNVVIHYI